MFEYLVLMLFCCILAKIIENRVCYYDDIASCVKNDNISKLLLAIIIISMTLFAGLRTWFNDTFTYIGVFQSLQPDLSSFSVFNYQGWQFYQSVIKSFVSEDPNVFLIITSAIMCILYINFILKRGLSFFQSIFILFCGVYLSMMAGMKQVLATGIGLYFIDYYMQNKYWKAVFVLMLAMSIHPFVVCLAAIVVLKEGPWSKKTLLLSLCMIMAVINLQMILGAISDFTKVYTIGEFHNEHTINPFRVVVECIPVILSFIYRKNLENENDSWLNLYTNMQIVAFSFLFISLFYNPIYFGRMAGYFSCLNFVMLPKMLDVCFKDREINVCLYYMFILTYFILDFTKLGTYGLFYDHFMHISIWELFM